MCKREADFLIKVYYLNASSAIKKSTCTLKHKLIKKTNKNSGKLCSKLKIKKTKLRHWHCSGIFVNFEQVNAKGYIQEKAEKSAHNFVDYAKEKTC